MDEAKKFSKALVDRRIVGCVNIMPVKSVYRNGGEVSEADEALMIVQTIDPKIAEVEETVRGLSSDTVPYAASFVLHRVNREYREWLASSVA